MEQEIGKITHVFDKINVAVIKIAEGELKTGDRLHLKGPTTDIFQTIDSMQVEHKSVETAAAGQAIGIKMDGPVRAGDLAYKITD
jgi:translation initiation factor IF-2